MSVDNKWRVWFAWYPVRLTNGSWAWLEDVDWCVFPCLRHKPNGLYTAYANIYRATPNRKPRP